MNVGPLSMHKWEEGDNEAPAWPKSLSLVSQSEPGQEKMTKAKESIDIEIRKGSLVENGDDGPKEEVEAWGNKTQFILACIGLAVGLGNVWRFPYLLHKNGGGAFLIPYFIMLLVEGLPMMYVEMAIGQYFRGGSVVSWEKIHPSLKRWPIEKYPISTLSMLTTPPYAGCDYTDDVCCTYDKTLYYWYAVVLKATPSIDDTGNGPAWHLVIFLILAWIVTYLCVFQGVKSTGKAAYFAATFPYACLIILLIRGVTLEGAEIGLKALFTPQWERLADPNVWISAATQTFFSLSLGFGALVAFASFMPYKNNITHDAILVATVNSFTSVLAGLCIYSILGFRSFKTGVSIDDVSAGSGLTFVAITEAVTQMNGTPFFAFVFFFMLFNLGISSQFGTLAGLVTPLYNDLKLFGKARKELCVAILAIFFCLIGLLFTPGNGEYMLQLFNNFPVTMPLLVVGITEIVATGWIFGIDNFDKAIIDMTGAPCPLYFKICIKYVSPAIMVVLLVWLMVSSIISVDTYQAFVNCNPDDAALNINKTMTFTVDKPLPGWARAVGGLMIVACVLPIAVYGVWKHMTWEEIKQAISGRRVYVIGEASKSSVTVSPADVKVNYAAHDDGNEYNNPI
ncbi:sodium- and chloride-dependent transporter XTRP3-like [Bolinopsis microptera]|uniref:sodium- and chloride-dependent transporter XTRP3-like n=1 Tax=Bolinopsis microptera TaxID=2820187 RepID=UPI00307AD2C0